MASPRSTFRIVGAEMLGTSTRVLDVVRTDDAPWANVGGKYVILDTGRVLADGKAVKRAYSLTPSGGGELVARLIVKRLDGGPGSGALHGAPIGTELSFSGPWGKLVPESGIEPSTLFVATDTGLTSALGAVATNGGESLTVLWLRGADESFFDESRARAAIEASGARFISADIPPIGSAGRAERAWAHVDAWVSELAPTTILAAGDGHIVFPLKSRVFPVSSVRDVRIECFFHNPEKKSA